MDDPVADLLIRCAAQDRTAFRALYAATSAKLMGVLLRMLQDRHEAEEALQEVYTRIWLRAQRFDPARGRGMTWVIAVARHLAIDRLRARPIATEEADYEHIPDSTPRAESRLVALGEARRIVDCFGTLEPARAAAHEHDHVLGGVGAAVAAALEVEAPAALEREHEAGLVEHRAAVHVAPRATKPMPPLPSVFAAPRTRRPAQPAALADANPPGGLGCPFTAWPTFNGRCSRQAPSAKKWLASKIR